MEPPEQLTITVTKGSASSSITTVVADPISPNASGAPPCQYRASQLAWVQPPSSEPAGAALFPPLSVAVEDKTGCIVQSDASPVTLAITAGTGTAGATLNNCAASLNYGATVFSGCSIAVPGTAYTLTASDPPDGLASVVSGPFRSPRVSGPAGLHAGACWRHGRHTVDSPRNQPKVWVEDAQGHLVTTDQSTVTLAIGNNPSNGTLRAAQRHRGQRRRDVHRLHHRQGRPRLHADRHRRRRQPQRAGGQQRLQHHRRIPEPAHVHDFAGRGGHRRPFQNPARGRHRGRRRQCGHHRRQRGPLTIGTNPGGGTLGGCSATTVLGLVTFSGCAINQAGNGYTLAASVTSLAGATSSPFNVAAQSLPSR